MRGKRLMSGLLAVVILLPSLGHAQTIIGQYEAEAPFRSWNIFGFVPASGLGRADIMTGAADGPAVAFSNPALLLDLPRLSFVLNGCAQKASFFRFALVNTGVLRSTNNIWAGIMALDFGGIAWRFRGWALSIGVAITEYYDRPSVRAESFSGGRLTYELDFNQEGFLRTWNIGLARQVGNWLSVGLAANLTAGSAETVTRESWPISGVSISDRKEARFKDFYLNAGLAAAITDSLRLTLALELPRQRHKDSHSNYEYSAPAGNTSIKIEGEAKDRIHRPLVIGLGCRYNLSQVWWLALEATFFNWSHYHLTWFGEDDPRSFRDVIRLAAAVENSSPLNLLGESFTLTSRIGVQIDPQPMKNPRSTYTSLSSGLSLRWKHLRLDFGAAWGQEKGSGRSLQYVRSSLSLAALF